MLGGGSAPSGRHDKRPLIFLPRNSQRRPRCDSIHLRYSWRFMLPWKRWMYRQQLPIIGSTRCVWGHGETRTSYGRPDCAVLILSTGSLSEPFHYFPESLPRRPRWFRPAEVEGSFSKSCSDSSSNRESRGHSSDEHEELECSFG